MLDPEPDNRCPVCSYWRWRLEDLQRARQRSDAARILGDIEKIKAELAEHSMAVHGVPA